MADHFNTLDVSTGGTSKLTAVSRARVTAGNITLPDTLSAWALLSTASIPQLTVAAAVGDEVDLVIHGMRSNTSTAFIDVVNVTGAGPTIQRYLATGTSSPADEGDPGWYPQNGFGTQSGDRGFTVTAGDLDGGLIRFRIATLSVGAGTLYASTIYPFYWEARVYQQ